VGRRVIVILGCGSWKNVVLLSGWGFDLRGIVDFGCGICSFGWVLIGLGNGL
jgi:hypothetical protein